MAWVGGACGKGQDGQGQLGLGSRARYKCAPVHARGVEVARVGPLHEYSRNEVGSREVEKYNMREARAEIRAPRSVTPAANKTRA